MGRVSMLALLFAFSAPALAGKVYRCPDGSYQDKPCGQGERVVAHNNPKAAPPPDADPACFDRGRAAGRLVAQRDKGISSDKVLKEIDASGKPYDQRIDEKAFAVKVYQTQGSATEVHAMFEAECVKTKRDEAARAAQAPAPAPAAPAGQATPQSDGKETAAQAEQDRLCKQLRSDVKRNKAKKRKGGSIDEMEALAGEGVDLQEQLRAMCDS